MVLNFRFVNVEMAAATMNCSTFPAEQLQTQQPSSVHSEALSSVTSTSFAPADAQEQIILVYNQKYMKSLDCRIRLAQLVSNSQLYSHISSS